MNEYLENMQEIIDYPSFFIDEYIAKIKAKTTHKAEAVNLSAEKTSRFDIICNAVREYFDQEWLREFENNKNNTELLLERHKNALIGHTTHVNYFKEKIKEYLKANNLMEVAYPRWYKDLVDAIFHENWGWAGIAEWISMKNCTSALIIGSRIFYFIKGKWKQQDQQINPDRFEQLKHALLLKTPEIRIDEEYIEVYMVGGERVAMFCDGITIDGQQAAVFRKYIVDKLTFEEQADRGTIPKPIVPLLKSMVPLGFNVCFVGPVRTGKSTFLTTYQMYEDTTQVGLSVQTDPEIHFDVIQPLAPIISLIADGNKLKGISKKIVRSDADYVIMAEARDGHAFNTVVDIADIGTRRCKTTCHLSKIENFCYKVANKIYQEYGGDINYHIAMVAESYNYLFQFVSLPKDKSKKRLKGIFEVRMNSETMQVEFHQICKYDFDKDSWTFRHDIGKDKEEIACEENRHSFNLFSEELKKLEELYPMQGDNVIYPFYSKVGGLK